MPADPLLDESIFDRRLRRRKQPYPLRIIQDPFALTEALERDVSEKCCKTDANNVRSFDNHICGQCSGEFFTMPAFIVHKRYCTNEWPVLVAAKGKSGDSDSRTNIGTDSAIRGGDGAKDDEAEALNLCVNPISTSDPISTSTTNFDAASDECAVFAPSLSPDGVSQIQSALRSLQGQQMVQLQLIQQIYTQLLSSGNCPTSIENAKSKEQSISISSDRSIKSDSNNDRNTMVAADGSTNSRLFSNIACDVLSPPNSGSETSPEQRRASIFDQIINRSIDGGSGDVSAFDALKSQVINSLKEMEQSVAQQIREQRKADTYLDKLYRHRCHFCGKVMSSESSLQIHIRSHTGERPYACRICDSRFSTKGNLKVHMDVHRGEDGVGNFENQQEETEKSENDREIDKSIFDTDKIAEAKSNNYFRFLIDNENEISFGKMGSRSLSVPCLSSSEKIIIDRFGDDSIIGKYSPNSSLFLNDEIENGDDDDVDNDDSSKEEEDVIVAENSRNAFADIGSIGPIDLRISSNLSISHKKTPPPIVASIPTPSFLSAPFFAAASFPTLTNLFPTSLPTSASSTSLSSGDLNRNHQAKSTSHLVSSFFVSPSQSSLLKIGIENGHRNASTASSTPISPQTGADLEEDWESMMEITTTDEAEKIRSLVGDRETKVTDPNQCMICHRILSCKSALQMHYRTHTGERPFKCKICSRAFTTKGNLKTHMGVHRTKPPFRLFHQCPICHKKFNNGVVLQQHIRLHTGQAPDMPIEHIHASEIREAPIDFHVRPQQPSSAHSNVSMLSATVNSAIGTDLTKRPPSTLVSPTVTPKPFERTPSSSSILPPPPPSTTKIQSPSSEKSTPRPNPNPPPAPAPENKFAPFSPFAAPPLDLLRNPAFANWLSRFGPAPFPLIPFSTSSSSMPSVLNNNISQSQSPIRSIPPPPPPPPSSMSLPPANPFSPIILPNPGQAPIFGRPNTTCNICFKTFACNSALEIHYRSHTKERPFKCTVCNRGFSTKGNMKQHLLTHKIRDTSAGPDVGGSSQNSLSRPAGTISEADSQEEHERQNSVSPPNLTTRSQSVITPSSCEENRSTAEIFKIDNIDSADRSRSDEAHFPPHLKREHSPSSENVFNDPTPISTNVSDEAADRKSTTTKKPNEIEPTPLESIQSMWARTESMASTCPSPTAKRPPVLSKHQCQVCYKHFSSSSALAIHMRTHTGERPFCCPACGRSFTTKGNLKVHMGTHSWQHAQSRRGRRIFDTPQSSFGFGDNQGNFVGDRSSTATSLDDVSCASSANSDLDRGASSPPMNQEQKSASKNGNGNKNGDETRKRKATTPPIFDSRNSTPSQQIDNKNGTNNLLSPNSFRAASSLLSNFSSTSTSPLQSSFLFSKANLQNGGGGVAGNNTFFANQISPSSNFNFLNPFQSTPLSFVNNPNLMSTVPASISSMIGGGGDQTSQANPMQAMLWMWRNVCSVCRHVCSSVSELEDHLKLHLANSNGGNEKINNTSIIPT